MCGFLFCAGSPSYWAYYFSYLRDYYEPRCFIAQTSSFFPKCLFYGITRENNYLTNQPIPVEDCSFGLCFPIYFDYQTVKCGSYWEALCCVTQVNVETFSRLVRCCKCRFNFGMCGIACHLVLQFWLPGLEFISAFKGLPHIVTLHSIIFP